MKTSNFLLALFGFATLTSCSILSKKDLTNTTWVYVDNDWTYEIHFMKNGALTTTHPNDKTVGNDTWEQKKASVYFYFNDRYSIYEAQRKGKRMMIGTGKNQSDSWAFTMTKK
ncbi:MAG: hypothetical protein JNJ57_03565 [Saprospiraceae bacterium]|nr:hypothetical protein [Saprospiraceae bacterium]